MRVSSACPVSGRGSNMGVTRLGCHNQDAVSPDALLLKRGFLGFRKTAAAKIVRFVTANPHV
jgi:hypothetical protein